jgi:hypothetical protein
VKLRSLLLLGALCASIVPTNLAAKDAGQGVDSGSFGVFVNGHRVATETFTVKQGAGGTSTVDSQVKQEGSDAPGQNSQLQMSAGGDLIHYEWHDAASKAQLVVAPNDQFLLERITTAPGEKPAEHPFLMPLSTMVLDNNFFVQRELLAWRYLGSTCKMEGGKTQCPLSPAEFGVIVPQERSSMRVSLQLVGKEKVKVGSADRDLLRVNLKDDSGEWALWLDDQNMFKLVRILVTSNNTEVLRD